MKKHTPYYIIGAVLVGVGIYMYASKKNNQVVVNLTPPLVVSEESTAPSKTETTIYTAVDKLKELINAIKAKGTSTPTTTA
jgi:hypothetical protein